MRLAWHSYLVSVRGCIRSYAFDPDPPQALPSVAAASPPARPRGRPNRGRRRVEHRSSRGARCWPLPDLVADERPAKRLVLRLPAMRYVPGDDCLATLGHHRQAARPPQSQQALGADAEVDLERLPRHTGRWGGPLTRTVDSLPG